MKQYFSLLALLTLCFSNSIKANEDFIDDLEYGKRLYENPRGISCQQCHGSKGEGMVIATYKSKGKTKQLLAPQINHLSLQAIMQNINKSNGVMPKYSLTEKEILAIYKFLKNQAVKETKEEK